jgi:AcrR family transcriptional regulator
MLDTAMRLMQSGKVPSVSEIAEAAGVSRTTAYRYFPTQTAMITATVDEALRPILEWSSDLPDAEERVVELLAFAFPRMEMYEATHRATLLMALDQWTRRQAGTLGGEEPIPRGRRIGVLKRALAPLKGELPRATFDKLSQSLSLVFGAEALVVLKDIWGLDGRQAERVALWTAQALIRAARAEAAAARALRAANAAGRTGSTNAAKRPRRKEN